MANWSDAAWQETMAVTLNTDNVLDSAVGPEHGLKRDEINGLAPRISEIDKVFKQELAEGKVGFAKLADDCKLVGEINGIAESVRGWAENFVVLGIGGSALGNICVHTALNHPYHNLLPNGQRNAPRIFVLDNVDPHRNMGCLDVIDLSKTAINVITKSGETAETMSSFLVFQEKLIQAVGREQHGKHIIATTDVKKGFLRAIANREGYQTLPIPDDVGGRYSVLSAVGLLSAATSGVDLGALLGGAAYMRKVCENSDPWTNPAYRLAAIHYLADTTRGQSMAVMMPYADALRDFGDWFRQLWAESLGKKLSMTGEVVHVGPTPIKALGTTDQHSQMQLYMEGPFNKLIAMIAVGHEERDGEIPASYQDIPEVGYLGGHTLGELLRTEQKTSAWALKQNQRPNYVVHVPEVNAFTLGQLFYLYELTTVVTGRLYGINPYDQPGVEAGKVATYALLGKPGYEKQRESIKV